MNKAGGSAAFGRFAAKGIKTRVGAQLATILLGVTIFIDDYFNCLTVGSVMRPVTDKFKVSRAKLAYLCLLYTSAASGAGNLPAAVRAGARQADIRQKIAHKDEPFDLSLIHI